MDIERSFLAGDFGPIPAIFVRPPVPSGAAVLVHGYGGCKEELTGLAIRVAEAGLLACTIDLRGHGEHMLPLDLQAGADVDAAIRFCRNFGRVTAIGHSLGGRLALISDADYHIAISPSLSRSYGDRTREMLAAMRSYRVRPADLAPLLALQEALPVWEPHGNAADTLVLYAEREAPEIVAGCTALEAAGVPALKIPGATHGDIFLLEPVFAAVSGRIRAWYGGTDAARPGQ